MSLGEACAKVGNESVVIQVMLPFSQQTALCVDSIESMCSVSVCVPSVVLQGY